MFEGSRADLGSAPKLVKKKGLIEMAGIDMLGFVGMTLLLSAFIFNQIKWFANDSFWYHMFNFVGAYILSHYAYLLSNTPFLILEFVWGSFSAYQLVVMLCNRSRNKS